MPLVEPSDVCLSVQKYANPIDGLDGFCVKVPIFI